MVACEKIADQELILYDFESEAVFDEVCAKTDGTKKNSQTTVIMKNKPKTLIFTIHLP